MDISNARLNSQQVADHKFSDIKDLVFWMGAMQAQDYNMVKWAIGSRLPHISETMIEAAIEKAEIIRTHLLRPTWHFASGDDIHWMLELSATHIRTAARSREKELEITEKLVTKSKNLLEKLLGDGARLTRSEIAEAFHKAKLNTDDGRLSHFLIHSEIAGLIFSRGSGGIKQTYSLLCESVPVKKSFTRDEALSVLAKRYFSSHGPATASDFSWWSGLSIVEAKKALASVMSELFSETTGGQTYFFTDLKSTSENAVDKIYLLPAFDEFVISYRDRTASIPADVQPRAFSSNGIFWPVIVVNGQIRGIWKQTRKKDQVIISAEFFRQKDKKLVKKLAAPARAYGEFLEKKVWMSPSASVPHNIPVFQVLDPSQEF